MDNIYFLIDELINYGINMDLIDEIDKCYIKNRVMRLLDLEDYIDNNVKIFKKRDVQEILDDILDWLYENKKTEQNTVTYRDLKDSEIMNVFISKPSEINKIFQIKLKKDPLEAAKYFYKLSENSNYIRTSRINKNTKWTTNTEFGDLDITINLSKPEKDPKEIAALKNVKSIEYPKCLLCRENEGYFGRINHPGRSNHRIVSLNLNNEKWYLQYSPYVYYDEHCIVLKEDHVPMKIEKTTFERLFSFIELLPHYFIGANADLPIVGGSILNHDHFQGGYYDFAMTKAKIEKSFIIKNFKDVDVHILKWPLSVIRLVSKNNKSIISLGDYILHKWKKYSDESSDIIAFTNDVSHNTITPIVRMRNGFFELDIVLRNNRTDNKHPMGIFHPHSDVHHIKKENIGLIEVMGLAVLPSRLKLELELIKKYLLRNSSIEIIKNDENLNKHIEWYCYLYDKYRNNMDEIEDIIRYEVGLKFLRVLKDAGVYKTTEKGRDSFYKFIFSL
ncbi:MAG: UDP-glucose--hexose-1-phosphate uridylyltransferase [Clostridiales bacterium]